MVWIALGAAVWVVVVVVFCACVMAGRADDVLERDRMARVDRDRLGL
jgi:hypothetical protein